jgi:RimJ/RimL family protein N-acetyltransferase
MPRKEFHNPSPIKLSASLGDASLTVETLTSNVYSSILRLKKENAEALRGWTVERDEYATSAFPKKSFAIFYDQFLVGEVALQNFSSLSCQISYWVAEDYWGRGIASTAVRLISEYAIEHLNVLEITAFVHTSNSASIKVLERSGYEYVDITNKKMYYEDVKAPHLLYSYAKI